ncbi:hypothetical protein KC19_7G135300 [Ceratodon purpureus]|nr:hypothetical protein KC19_7G135300 [Ceratodon purpureus]KAG0567443.1 hypothetical protein KC19_7G135300 [Ceratodon purpureus]
MDASIITRSTLATSFSLLRSFRPQRASQSVSYLRFLHSDQRVSPRLCASSEPPLVYSPVESKERDLEQEFVEDDGVAGSTSTLRSLVDLETETGTEDVKDGVSVTVVDAVREGLVKEAAEEELRSGSSGVDGTGFKNVDPSSLGRRRKRKQFVAKAPKRLHSDEEDLGFMKEALAEARKGAKKGEVPVGAVLVHNKKIIARFHNQVEAIGDPTAHAEMLCIRSAAAQLGGWRLTDVSMYVTLEPCPMCAGAILQGRVSELVWGARNSLLGADGSWIK